MEDEIILTPAEENELSNQKGGAEDDKEWFSYWSIWSRW